MGYAFNLSVSSSSSKNKHSYAWEKYVKVSQKIFIYHCRTPIFPSRQINSMQPYETV